MNLFGKFQQGLAYADFLSRHGTDVHRQRWRQVHDQVALTVAQRQLLGSFTRQMNVLVLAGAWCGDCVNQCPIFEHFAAASRVLTVRYLDRDEHSDAQQELQINAGSRVPVVVFLSIMDLPTDRRAEFVKWAGGYTTASDQETKDASASAVADYLRSIVDERYANPGDDLLSRIAGWRDNPRFQTIETWRDKAEAELTKGS